MNPEQAAICIQSCIRGYFQRVRMKKEPLTYEKAATIIQKFYRGFFFRKTLSLYKQRFNIQMLCFLQQLELINNDFFTKIVRTNYCVPLKSIESTNFTGKSSTKLLQHLFPPPPPPPLPLPNKFENFSPTISRQVEPVHVIPTPVPPLVNSPRQQQFMSTPRSNRSPSPVSKFAQVRDIFARAEATTSIPMKNLIVSNLISSHTIPSIERTRSPKAASVLNAVQEYQRQHINNHQPMFKRFIPLANSGPASANRSPNISAIRPRAMGHVSANNNKLINKSSLSAYSTSSPQLQLKSITRVISD